MNKSKEILKELLNYTIIFIVLIFIFMSSLTLVNLIDTKHIETNISESMNYIIKYEDKIRTSHLIGEKFKVDNFADEVLYNLSYMVDSNKPFKSIFANDMYVDKTFSRGNNANVIKYAIDNNAEPNYSYERYWHGSLVFLRPLTVLFTYMDLRYLNVIMLAILVMIVANLLLNKTSKLVAYTFLIGLLFTNSFVVPFCFEYVVTYYIFLLTSIYVLSRDGKEYKDYYKLFFIIGALTAFFDFLTTEILTLFIPLIFIILKDEFKSKSIKEDFKLTILSSIAWAIAYVGTFLAKWTLNAIVYRDRFSSTLSYAAFRITGEQESGILKQIGMALNDNIGNLFPLNMFSLDYVGYIVLGIIIIAGIIIFLYRKKANMIGKGYVLMFISLMPYLRYIVLNNHSEVHSFFTYRTQLIFIIAITCSFIFIIDKKLIEKDYCKIWKMKKEKK